MLTSFFERYLPDIDRYMRTVVNSQQSQPSDMGIMLQYALGWVDQNGDPYNIPTGKRIRPVLLLLCVEAAGGNWKAALPAAAAVELLHNFSLIHDDIQDDSPLRHNRPTVWKVWGEANAINIGDALFTMAYDSLQRLSEYSVPDQILIQIWRIFNKTMLELTRGQHLDMRFEHQPTVKTDEYISMITGKSAALLSACAEMGALIGSGDAQLAHLYADFGLNLGIAFQIHDDILGIWGNPSVTGKSAATDILSRKKSLPVLYGLDNSAELVGIYQRPTFTQQDVDEAIKALNDVNAQDFTRHSEEGYYNTALASIEAANPQGEASEWIMQLVNSLFERNY
ncbi:MAG: polyprenyl synthetase family protein [Anaerolineaceae bacterium]|nr:polyprenyl synthetase family protein [Anaerolineaceae bacterium]